VIDKAKLRAAWVAKGKTQEDVAKIIGISNKTMSLRMKNGVFGSDEMQRMIDALDIKKPADIFFVREVT
jgi:DNA-binding XRE family transcriptional regulator